MNEEAHGMLWRGGRKSENVEDNRGAQPSGGGGMRRGAGLGAGAILLIFVVSWLLGIDPRQVLQVAEQVQAPSSYTPAPRSGPATGQQDEQGDFASVILASTEDVWTEIFAAKGAKYTPPKLVLFSEAVDSACGYTSAAVGPFYCPRDREVYLDTSFFRELEERFGAPGDFAQAYVIGHEVGHHVQELLGVNDDIHAMERGADEVERNRLSVAVELQADCLAGVWAKHSQQQRKWLETGDVEEGLNAAAAIGDDRLQREAGGRVAPETWTHGSSQQRVTWFKRGFESGEIGACDTLAGGR